MRTPYVLLALLMLTSASDARAHGSASTLFLLLIICGGGALLGAMAGVIAAFGRWPKLRLGQWILIYMALMAFGGLIYFGDVIGLLAPLRVGLPSLVFFVPAYMIGHWLARKCREPGSL